jgi:hypothetical protein
MTKSVVLILVIGATFDTITVDVFVAVNKFVAIFASRLRRAKENAAAPPLEDCAALPEDHASAQIEPAIHS